jgi:methyl coenzyme M reductase gamma subunit
MNHLPEILARLQQRRDALVATHSNAAKALQATDEYRQFLAVEAALGELDYAIAHIREIIAPVDPAEEGRHDAPIATTDSDPAAPPRA